MAEVFNQTPSCISTVNGFFDILKPEDYDYDIQEIALALSKICRYTGHVAAPFYSVAEHSVLVSHLVPKRLALAGLLHDASEAFVGDISTPLKKLLKDYKPLEQRIQMAIANSFEADLEHPDVKKADQKAYWLERASVAKPPKGAEDTIWHQEYKTNRGPKPIGLYPEEAYVLFMERFNALVDEQEGFTLEAA